MVTPAQKCDPKNENMLCFVIYRPGVIARSSSPTPSTSEYAGEGVKSNTLANLGLVYKVDISEPRTPKIVQTIEIKEIPSLPKDITSSNIVNISFSIVTPLNEIYAYFNVRHPGETASYSFMWTKFKPDWEAKTLKFEAVSEVKSLKYGHFVTSPINRKVFFASKGISSELGNIEVLDVNWDATPEDWKSTGQEDILTLKYILDPAADKPPPLIVDVQNLDLAEDNTYAITTVALNNLKMEYKAILTF